jgi:hypothetical protein
MSPEALIRKRGGAMRYRTKKLSPTKYMHIAVVPKTGKRGGHTIAGKVRTKKRQTRIKRYSK